MIRIINFIRHNRDKSMTIKIWFWTALFRFIILTIPSKYVEKYYGISGEESTYDESADNYAKARRIAYHVNRIAEHTPWDSRCLVRALTAQRLLTKKKISSTLYLGVRKDGEKLVAHAWIRTGMFYATGGNGDGYAIVSKHRK